MAPAKFVVFIIYFNICIFRRLIFSRLSPQGSAPRLTWSRRCDSQIICYDDSALTTHLISKRYEQHTSFLGILIQLPQLLL